MDCVAQLTPALNRLLESIWLLVSLIYLQSGTDQITGHLRMLSSSIPLGYGTVLTHILLKGNKEKERTVKSSRNSVYGAPEHSWLLELAMEVHVKAASCWTYSGICQMVKSLKHTYRLTETTLDCYRCIHCLSNAVHTQTHISTLLQLCYCSWTVPPQPVAPLPHAMCRLKAPQVTERDGKPK